MKKSKTLGCVLLAFFLAATLLVAKQKNKAKTNSQTQAKDEQLFAAEPKQYPFTLIAYGDLRTTDLSNHSATNPERRQALIARIATEKPDLLVVNGDLVLSGGNAGDWLANAARGGVVTADAPSVGAVVVYRAGGAYSELGHVAIVTAVSPDTYTVSEMHAPTLGVVSTRVIRWPDPAVLGFIPRSDA